MYEKHLLLCQYIEIVTGILQEHTHESMSSIIV